MRTKLLALGLAILLAGWAACEREEGEDIAKAHGWMDTLEAAIPALGHRNWIVVSDAAFPLQVSPGIEMIVTNEDHFAVLEKVLKAVDKDEHLRPKIWLDEELAYVTEDLAPGAEGVSERLEEALEGRGADFVLHEELISRLDQAGKAFKIVMLKTTLAVPYTSVFLELDCGYWSPEAEAKMRERMK
jgi:D-ribose pyranose/furanose isomerase RbsD